MSAKEHPPRTPRLRPKSVIWLVMGGLGLFGLGGCEAGFETISGATMGTYYTVQYRTAGTCQVAVASLDAELEDVNASMSTYRPDSEVSRFNQSRSTEAVAISAPLETVLREAHRVWQASGGAFDVTVAPLVDLWGFGAPGKTDPPTQAQQDAARERVGMQWLELGPGTLRKQRADLSVDLSALAKGYAVDVLAGLLKERGCTDFMVDIGGEMRLNGRNRRGKPWRIGVEVPDAGAVGQTGAVLELSGAAVATSGDYRNFRVLDGARIDHVIDPRAGGPATSSVVSVTVVHESAMVADAYATAFMVLSPQEAIDLADGRGLAVYLMFKPGATDPVDIRYNDAMRNYFPES